MSDFQRIGLGMHLEPYTPPSNPVDPSVAELWASSHDLYCYYNLYFWNFDGKNIATADYPIVSFYIIDEEQGTKHFLEFNGQYQDGLPVWSAGSYLLRYSLAHKGWILQTIGSVPYIPIKSTDSQLYSYGWYFSRSWRDPFTGYCLEADSNPKELVATYALIQTEPLVFEVDDTKQMVQHYGGSSVSFGYRVAKVTTQGLPQDINENCYYLHNFMDPFAGVHKFKGISDSNVYATLQFIDATESEYIVQVPVEEGSISFTGSNLNLQGTNVLTYQTQEDTYTLTIKFTGQFCQGNQRVPCYYGEVATWS